MPPIDYAALAEELAKHLVLPSGTIRAESSTSGIAGIHVNLMDGRGDQDVDDAPTRSDNEVLESGSNP
jgi:hypothetical protein